MRQQPIHFDQSVQKRKATFQCNTAAYTPAEAQSKQHTLSLVMGTSTQLDFFHT
jgi:hypothetical protein